jgi:hypothetical protein
MLSVMQMDYDAWAETPGAISDVLDIYQEHVAANAEPFW